MIKKILISNLGPYKNCEVNFNTGKTAILGQNGSGKTTLLKCIIMALWGDSRYILKSTINDFIRISEDVGSVELTFERNDFEYVVKRTWRRNGTNTASLKTLDGVITGAQSVNEEIEKIFAIPTKNWVDITWARQGEIHSMLSGDKEVFDRLLGISDLENAWKRMRDVQSTIKSDMIREQSIIEELSKRVKFDEEEVTSRLHNVKEDLARSLLKLKKIKLDVTKEDVSESLIKAKSIVKKMELDLHETFEVIDKGGVCPLCKQLITEKHKVYMKTEIKDIKKRIKGKEEELRDLEQRAEEYKEEQAAIKSQEIEKARLESEITHFEQGINELSSDLASIKKSKDAVEKRVLILHNLEKELELITKFREAFRISQPYLRSGRIDSLQRGVLTIFDTMFSERFSRFDIDEDYKMTIWNGRERSASTLSGGESIALAIALRLSVVNVIGNQELLILDEPTSHLDEERIQQLIEVIDKITTNDQIFIVTHNDLLTGVSDNVINVKRYGEASVVE